ncbi:hypothetical protein ABH955_004150 [Bacillus sp. RC240]
MARDNELIQDNSTLLHVDQYLDAAIDGAAVPWLVDTKG